MKNSPAAAVEAAISELRSGRILILVDSPDRENEGDLLIAAEFADEHSVNFMASFGKGLICVPLTVERAQQLELKPMVSENTALHSTAFTVSVDALSGTSTGISAGDRAETIRQLASPGTKASDFGRPGHVFPLIAAPGRQHRAPRPHRSRGRFAKTSRPFASSRDLRNSQSRWQHGSPSRPKALQR